MNIHDRVVIVSAFNTWGKYQNGDTGTIVEKWQTLTWKSFVEQQETWNYTVAFDNGNTATVREDEMQPAEAYTPEEVSDFHIIITPYSTIYITHCGADAPDTWFNHATGNFFSTDVLERILNYYRTEEEVIIV